MLLDGWSQKDAGAKVHVSQSTVARIAAGLRGEDKDGKANWITTAESQVHESPPPRAFVGDLLDQQDGPGLVEALIDFPTWCERFEHIKLAPHQREWIEFFQAEDFALILAPPGSGKSFLWSVQHTTWLIAGGGFAPEYYRTADNPLRNRLIAIVSRTEEQAGKNFDGVEARLTDNKAIVQAFGRFKEPDLTWTKSAGTRKLVVAGREHHKLTGDPTLRIMSGKSAVLGFRADILKVDDLADLESCNTPEATDKLMLKFRAEVATRQQGGSKMWVIMARLPIPHCPSKQFEDMVYEAEDGSTQPIFAKQVCPAVVDEKTRTTLWPQVQGFPNWTQLMKTKGMVGDRVWETMYMQNPLADGIGFVSRAAVYGGPEYPGILDHDRTWGDDFTVVDEFENACATVRVMTVDPSPREFWGCLLMDIPVSLDRVYNPHLIDIRRERLGTNGFYALVEEWFYQFDFKYLVIEKNAAHSMLQDSRFQDICSQRGIHVIYHGTTGASKHDTEYGLPTIAQDIEAGLIRVPWGDMDSQAKFKPLVDEILAVDHTGQPTSRRRTNDVLMSLWFPKWNLDGLLVGGGKQGTRWLGNKPRGRIGPPPRLVAQRAS